jgi:hypothetical protein
MRYCALFAVLLFAGCSSARLVSSDSRGGCVAVADSTDHWPTYNMTKARELMQKQCPGGYAIVKQEEVVVGQTTTNNTQRDTKEVPIVKGLVNGVQETTQRTTSVHDQTEWRIWYERK